MPLGRRSRITLGRFELDPLNCGACGYSCKGTTCSTGKCQPQALATFDLSAHGLAQDATYLYVATTEFGTPDSGPDGEIVRVSKVLSADRLVLAARERAPQLLVEHAGQIYWTTWFPPNRRRAQ